MTFPQGPAAMQPTQITQYIRNMQSQLDEATRQTLYSAVVSAGGLTIRQGGAFVVQNATGTYNVLETQTRYFTDGTSYQPVVINRPPTGEPAFAIWPTQNTANAPFFWGLFDRSGNYIVTDDAVSKVGLSKPWLGFPLYQQWVTPVTPGVPYGAAFLNYTTSMGTGGKVDLWTGRIPYVSHPYLEIDGYWGWSGTPAGTITYTVQVGSLAPYTFTHSTAGIAYVIPSSGSGIDLRSIVGTSGVPISISVSCPANGTIFAQVYSSFLRGT